MSLLMCEPKYFGIDYSINAWMDVNNQVDYNLANSQWRGLVNKLILAGEDIFYMNPQSGMPDLVFTANSALLFDGKAVISRFRDVERQVEQPVNTEWFNNQGYYTELSPVTFEGAGDALFAGGILYLGYGFRSSIEAKSYLSSFGLNIVQCELVDPRFYHLDTCFCPLNARRALIYKPAIKNASDIDLELIEVPEAEAARFACNAVCINDESIVMPSGCPESKARLEALGYNVLDTDMSEFLKSGGACKCLTIKL